MAAKTTQEKTATPPSAGGGTEFDIDDAAVAFDGEKLSGGWDGPMWLPHLVEFSDKVIQQKLATANPGSTSRETIAGTLAIGTAWQRRLYLLDVPLKGGKLARYHLPEHTALYGLIDWAEEGAKLRLSYAGRGEPKPGQQAPMLYTVEVERGRKLKEPRKDVPIIRRKDKDEAPATATTEKAALPPDDVPF